MPPRMPLPAVAAKAYYDKNKTLIDSLLQNAPEIISALPEALRQQYEFQGTMLKSIPNFVDIKSITPVKELDEFIMGPIRERDRLREEENKARREFLRTQMENELMLKQLAEDEGIPENLYPIWRKKKLKIELSPTEKADEEIEAAKNEAGYIDPRLEMEIRKKYRPAIPPRK